MKIGEYKFNIFTPHPDGDGHALVVEQLIEHLKMRYLTTDGWKEREINQTIVIEDRDFIKLDDGELFDLTKVLLSALRTMVEQSIENE